MAKQSLVLDKFDRIIQLLEKLVQLDNQRLESEFHVLNEMYKELSEKHSKVDKIPHGTVSGDYFAKETDYTTIFKGINITR